jgi:formate dehydrogenase subunit delta
MNIVHLVRMANDIGQYFVSEPRRENAVKAIADHIEKSWDPRMRRQIEKHLSQGGDGLEELVKEAVARLAAPETT